MQWIKSYTTFFLILLILIGIVLRFYNLNWGAPFYFHPDERNIASAVSQLVFPVQMNPHFFAYGSLPLYVIFFTGLILNFLSSCLSTPITCLSTEALAKVDHVSFELAIVISRIYSAIFSVLLIPLLFSIGKKLYGRAAGLLTAALATFSVGFIQFAHFGTTEMWLAFFCTVLLSLFLFLVKEKHVPKVVFFLIPLVLGILVSVKISSLILLALPLPALFVHFRKNSAHKLQKAFLKSIIAFLLIMITTALFYILTNPYVLLDTQSFIGSMRYESTVATGALPVFYTQEFFQTTPIVFQFLSIYPFLLNPFVTLLFIPAFLLILSRIRKKQSIDDAFVLLFFLILFLSQAILFVKWTRYMVPTLPFIYLILGGALYLLTQHIPRKAITALVSGILVLLSGLYALSFLITVYGTTDTRIAAADYAKQHLPSDASYLSEAYDLGITPFNPHFSNITLFNFYDLETGNPEATPTGLSSLLTHTDFVILPSQRLYKTRLLQPEHFSEGYNFYQVLDKEQGYRKIYETSCDIFCRITYLNNPIFAYEETASVFDRPTVMIFQKL